MVGHGLASLFVLITLFWICYVEEFKKKLNLLERQLKKFSLLVSKCVTAFEWGILQQKNTYLIMFIEYLTTR